MNRQSKSYLGYMRTALLLASLVTLSACDGGLFGTGDGGDVIVADNNPAGIQNPEAAPDSPGDESMAPSSSDTEALIPTLSFNNLLNGSDQTEPVIALLNVSAQPLNLSTESDGTLLFEQGVIPGSLSETANLAVGENFLDVVNNNELAQSIFSIRPLNAGVASVTLLIARDLPGRSPDIVPLRTATVSTTPSVAQVRIVQATLLDDTDSPATFALQPTGSVPGNATISFPNIAASSAAQAAYQNVGAGTYTVVDSLNRFEPMVVSVVAGEIYTLIITDSTTPVLLLQNDTQLLDP